MLDDRDRHILALLQQRCDAPIAEVAEAVHLSLSACARRISRLEEDGFIARRVAVLSRAKMGLPTTVFVAVKTGRHSAEWVELFRRTVNAIPEIVEVHRLTGDLDYLLKIVLPNVEAYDHVYKRIVEKIDVFDMSAYISMEVVKSSTELPTHYAT